MDREANGRSFDRWYLSGPYLLTAIGVVLSALANAFRPLDDSWAVVVRVVLLAAGVVVAAGAVVWKLRTYEPDALGRNQAAVLVAIANLAVLGSYFALDQKQTLEVGLLGHTFNIVVQEWDSMRLMLLVLWWIGVAGAVLVYLPVLGRKIVVSLAILFHFGGITTAVTAVNVGTTTNAPWVPTMLWNHVYQNYLHFTYLNNAYHFYSPDPGPPTLVWFVVEFKDGSTRTEKLMSRKDCSTQLRYQRFLALTESVNQYYNTPQEQSPDLSRKLLQLYGSAWDDLRVPEHKRSFMDTSSMYHEPRDVSRRYIQSYVRFVARNTKDEDNPDMPVRSVRVYKLQHRILNPYELYQGLDPKDPTSYLAWYLGQYNPQGELIYEPAKPKPNPDLLYYGYDKDGKQTLIRRPNPDPFLYFSLPIYRIPLRTDPDITNPSHWELINTLDRHMYPEKYEKPNP